MDQEADNALIEDDSVHQPGIEAAVRDLCDRLSLDQLVLMRLYGRSLAGDLSRSGFVALLENFALELPRRKQKEMLAIASELASNAEFEDALKKGSHSNFGLLQDVLRSAKQQNALPQLMQTILGHQPSRRPLALLYRDTLRKQLQRLGAKTFAIFWFTGMIMLFIVPELQKIYQEFGIDLPTSMSSFMWLADWFAKTLLIWVILATCLFLYVVWKQGLAIRRNLRAINPWHWLQQPLTKRQRRKLRFASDGCDSATPISAKRSEFTKREVAALETASSPQTRNWLIGYSLKQDDQRNARRRSWFGDGFVLVWNLMLACLVGWIAISILSSLITIVEALC